MEIYTKEFNEWIADGNVVTINGYYSTQDAQYKNRLKSKRELYKYFVREFFVN
jgi:hypothetical protein